MKKYIVIIGAILLIAASSTAYAQIIYDAKAMGGGSIAVPGGRATFGFVALYADGANTPRGNLQYIDHGARLKVHGNVEFLTVYGTTAIFGGTATITDVTGTTTGTYTAMAVDNGQPGNEDEFYITLNNGNPVGGTLKGGNIQVSGQTLIPV